MSAAGVVLSCMSPRSGTDAGNVRPVAACMVELKSGVSGSPLRLMSMLPSLSSIQVTLTARIGKWFGM